MRPTRTPRPTADADSGNSANDARLTWPSSNEPETDDEDETPWGNRNYRHFRMVNGRLVAYWTTVGRAAPGPEDFGKVFG